MNATSLPFYRTRWFWLGLILVLTAANIFIFLPNLLGESLVHNFEVIMMVIGATPISAALLEFLGKNTFTDLFSIFIAIFVLIILGYRAFYNNKVNILYSLLILLNTVLNTLLLWLFFNL